MKVPPNHALLLGLVISVCGLSLLCVLCGLGFLSLALSGIAMMSYVVVSSYERSQYAVAEENIRSLFPRVFSWGDMALYQVRQP